MIGKKAMICLREPSLGPCFGMKGGAAGGGYAQVVPMEDINLHFTGDFHAIGAANNLLAAMVDNHVYWGNELGIDPRRVTWRRGLDMNDRALRPIISSLGGVANGFPREDGFDIIVASRGHGDLLPGDRPAGSAAPARQHHRRPDPGAQAGDAPRELKAAGAMTALLEGCDRAQSGADAREQPGLHPWRAVRQHRAWLQLGDRHQDRRLKLADYVVTEAGFGADLGAEKFFDIKCRKAGLEPGRGGRGRDGARVEDAWRRRARRSSARRTSRRSKRALPTSRAISRTFARFGVPAVVSVNRFSADTEAEHARAQGAVRGARGSRR